MNKQLAHLISDYQTSVRSAIIEMKRSGIAMPYTAGCWIDSQIPAQGKLQNGINYFKHGYGCRVYLPTGDVDFDFGELGEIGGFDAWRLSNFAEGRLSKYGFETKEQVLEHFEAEDNLGTAFTKKGNLYYLSNIPPELAVEVDYRFAGDTLPIRELDPVITLYVHYFLAADFMREDYKRLKLKQKSKSRYSKNHELRLRTYLSSWLGFLYVTVEAFTDLKLKVLLLEQRPNEFLELAPKVDTISQELLKHSDSLRKLRNKIFHVRINTKEVRHFFSPEADRLAWADGLHDLFADFFSTYQILCEVHCLLNNRKIESQMIQNS